MIANKFKETLSNICEMKNIKDEFIATAKNGGGCTCMGLGMPVSFIEII